MPRARLIQFRSGTRAEWDAVSDPSQYLEVGEPGYVEDENLLLIGDGVSAPSALSSTGAGTAIAPNMFGDVGEHWSTPFVRGTAALTAGALYTHAVFVPFSCTIDRIGANVTVGAASSTVTLGIYEDDGAGNPGALLLDAGTIDGNSATAQEKTVDQDLAGGHVYHLAALVAVGTPTLTTITGANGTGTGRNNSLANAFLAAGRTGRVRTGVVGAALPDPAATTTLQGGVPLISVRFA